MSTEQLTDTAARAAEEAKAKLKETLAPAAETISSAKDAAKAAADQARSMATEAGGRLKDAAGKAVEQGREALGDLPRRGPETMRYLSDRAAAYPLWAVLIAAAAGYGLGMMIARRR